MAPPDGGFWAKLKAISRGDVGFLASRLDHHISRAERHVDAAVSPPDAVPEPADEPRALSREQALAKDVATIAGIAVTMLGIKALKILPNLPFAPGHKLVLLTPLYVVAALYTRSRVGAMWTGLTMGVVAFLFGDGKYGIFEILKHVVPGLLCDLFALRLALFTLRSKSRVTSPLLWSLAGGTIAAGRFATIFTVTLFVQAPAVAWAFLVPGATVHITFGVLSGYVSHHLVRAVARRPRGKLADALLAEGAPPREKDSGADPIDHRIRKEAT